ncbi:MAG TPA: OmpA family protein [Candidatus Gastranaerophilales bacterium]|nr:OmpA family protein [Candidatus Gastranaerophilales bacterium]
MKEDISSHNWQSIADIMSALMMIFLFISVLYMLQAQLEKAKITEIAKSYSEQEKNLYEDLNIEFKEDLKKWSASLEKDNTVRFYAPEVLFKPGSSEINPQFKKILNDFFPRYIKILEGSSFKNDISEIRIEGHTSSEWTGAKSFEDRYLANLNLSQQRSFEVLKYCFSVSSDKTTKEWLKGVLRANGLSFAKPVFTKSGKEDNLKSRRVEFRAVVKSKERIDAILEMTK